MAEVARHDKDGYFDQDSIRVMDHKRLREHLTKIWG